MLVNELVILSIVAIVRSGGVWPFCDGGKTFVVYIYIYIYIS